MEFDAGTHLFSANRTQDLDFKMDSKRLFKSTDFLQSCGGEPIRSVVTQSVEATVVAWHVEPGQTIAAHAHPQGQDTWTILAGSGQYRINAEGETTKIYPGDIVVAYTGQIHGVFNDGDEALIFISVVSPSEAGYQPL